MQKTILIITIPIAPKLIGSGIYLKYEKN